MNRRIEDRLEKLEERAEQRHDLSGRQALNRAQREWLIKLSGNDEAMELSRQSVDLMLAGVAKDSAEWLDLERRWNECLVKHYGTQEEAGDESTSV